MIFASEVYLEESIQRMNNASLREKLLYLKKYTRKEKMDNADLNRFFEVVNGGLSEAYDIYEEIGAFLMIALFRAVDRLVENRREENPEAEKFYTAFPRQYVEDKALQEFFCAVIPLLTTNTWTLVQFGLSTYYPDLSFDNAVSLQRLTTMFRTYANSPDFFAEYR